MDPNRNGQRQQGQQLHDLNQQERFSNQTPDGRYTRQPISIVTSSSNIPRQQNTASQPNPRFSYMATPVEAQAPTFAAVHRQPTIPQSPNSPEAEIAPDHQSAVEHYPPEKPTVHVPAEQHPAFSAPYAEPSYTASQSQTEAPRSPPEAPQSPKPVPLNPSQSAEQYTSVTPQYTKMPYSPTSSKPIPTFEAPPFSPHAATGPNGIDTALHQPGQIAHPNMSNGSKEIWTHSLCSCSDDLGTCCLGLWCPCILYGRTSYRLSRKSEKKDPTEMLGHSNCNGHCVLWMVVCGLQGLPTLAHRLRVRHAYKIPGSLPMDALESCCCTCCVLVQSELEVKGREERARRLAGPAGGYAVNERMNYLPGGGS
ncbi:MAG: hypothetical protein M1820_001096 [Bogoriella megaspora]|nr:MAG: hypothetical protein M1820_001096 [Bogoriella megaspora]